MNKIVDFKKKKKGKKMQPKKKTKSFKYNITLFYERIIFPVAEPERRPRQALGRKCRSMGRPGMSRVRVLGSTSGAAPSGSRTS